MLIRVLGSAAGGGFPQWNCKCRNCAGVRAGRPGFSGRARSRRWRSAATDGIGCCSTHRPIFASRSTTPLSCSGADEGAMRDSPIKAAVLTNGDVDHVTGLLNLREVQPFYDLRLEAGARDDRVQLASSMCWPRISSRGSNCRSIEPVAAGMRRRRPWADRRSLRRSRQGRALPRRCQRRSGLRHPSRRHHRPQGLCDPLPASTSSTFPAAPA